MTTTTWKAMGIAVLMIAPATAGARPHDAYAEMIPDCQQARIQIQQEVDPMLEWYDAQVFSTCDTPQVQVAGVAELWVRGEMVDSQPLDARGNAKLYHLRGGSLSTEPACVIIRGEQFQSCEHKVNDTPGHLRHGASFPVQAEFCGYAHDNPQ